MSRPNYFRFPTIDSVLDRDKRRDEFNNHKQTGSMNAREYFRRLHQKSLALDPEDKPDIQELWRRSKAGLRELLRSKVMDHDSEMDLLLWYDWVIEVDEAEPTLLASFDKKCTVGGDHDATPLNRHTFVVSIEDKIDTLPLSYNKECTACCENKSKLVGVYVIDARDKATSYGTQGDAPKGKSCYSKVGGVMPARCRMSFN
jgi:hypothetical protein